MNKILINSSNAGIGKTHQWIVPAIKTFNSMNENTLVVVSGLTLQQEIHNVLPWTISINSEEENMTTVSKRITDIMSTNHINGITVLITNNAFLSLDFDKKIKSKWNFIMDEVIEPFRELTFLNKQNINGVKLDLTSLAEIQLEYYKCYNDTYLPKEYPGYHDILTTNAIGPEANSEGIKDLTDQNWITKTTIAEYLKFRPEYLGNQGFNFVQQLKPHLFQDWKSIRISAANFEVTLMAKWLSFHNFIFNYEKPEHKYIKERLPMTIFTSNITVTSTIQTIDSSLIQKFTREVVEKTNINDPLIIRNSKSRKAISNEIKVQHNMHGLNCYRDKSLAIYNSSLKRSKFFYKWLKDEFNINYIDHVAATDAYLTYQLIFRTSIRNRLPNPARVYLGIACKTTFQQFIEHYVDKEYEGPDGFNFELIELDLKKVKDHNSKESNFTEQFEPLSPAIKMAFNSAKKKLENIINEEKNIKGLTEKEITACKEVKKRLLAKKELTKKEQEKLNLIGEL